MLIFIIWLEPFMFESIIILLVLSCISITLKVNIIRWFKMTIYLGVFLKMLIWLRKGSVHLPRCQSANILMFESQGLANWFLELKSIICKEIMQLLNSSSPWSLLCHNLLYYCNYNKTLLFHILNIIVSSLKISTKHLKTISLRMTSFICRLTE